MSAPRLCGRVLRGSAGSHLLRVRLAALRRSSFAAPATRTHGADPQEPGEVGLFLRQDQAVGRRIEDLDEAVAIRVGPTEQESRDVHAPTAIALIHHRSVGAGPIVGGGIAEETSWERRVDSRRPSGPYNWLFSSRQTQM